MIVEIGIVEVLNTRVAVAFVPTEYVNPFIGEQLVQELRRRFRYLSPMPLMLYSEDGRGYAAFQAHEFAKRITRADVVEWFEIDTDKDEADYMPDPF